MPQPLRGTFLISIRDIVGGSGNMTAR